MAKALARAGVASRREIERLIAEGRVALRGPGDAVVVLGAGDLGLASSRGVSAQRGIDASGYMGWREGRLVFEAVPLRDVLAQLERWRGVRLAVPDSALARRPLTATFTGESVDEILDIIGLALDADVERRGSTLILVPKS